MRIPTRSIVFAALGTFMAAPIISATASTLTVQSGQTLWSIAQSHHTTVAEILKLNPSIHGDTIQVGMKLVLPGNEPKSSPPVPARKKISVQSGDTLWSIAERYHTTVNRLQALNPQLHQSVTIKAGSTLWVPAAHANPSSTINRSAPTVGSSRSTSATRLSSRNDSFGSASASADAENLYWMARIIHAEANGQPLQAQIAVGDVVWHRMLSQQGTTVKDIVFQQSNGHYQFSTVPEGYIYSAPDADSQTAAVDVLEKHMDVVPGAFVFYGAHQSNDSWVLQQPVVATIGDFVFAK